MPDYPTDHEAERHLLSCMMRGGSEYRMQAADAVTADMFDRYTPVARQVLRIARKGNRPDADTVRSTLNGESVLMDDIEEVRPVPANTPEFISRVHQAHAGRRIQILASKAYSSVESGTDWLQVVDEMEQSAIDLTREIDTGDTTHVSDAVKAALHSLEQGQDEQVIGIETPFHRLNELMRGWQDTDLSIIAGRPSMGKTALALTCALHAGVDIDEPATVAIYSLEMGSQQLASRMIAQKAKVNTQSNLTDDEWQRLARAAGRINDSEIYIDDEPSLDTVGLRSRLRRLDHEHGVDLAIVDFLQLMKGSRRDAYGNRNQEVGAITRGLKLTAKDLGIPILALAQLSRKVESRTPPRPVLSDLRDSGEIEEHADNVLFVYRPEYYGITHDEAGNPTDGTGEIIVSKQRNGPTGTVQAAFVEEHASWEELDQRENHAPSGGAPF